MNVEPQTFCLDFDNTFTADPILWSKWVKRAQERGHRVVCITGRRETFDNKYEMREALPDGVDIFFAYDKPKMLCAEENSITVDVWIDDWPSLITDGYSQ